jgi:chitin synthase
VRRRAEHFWGKVTCLPGCITMIKCRPECAGAIEKYAEAITKLPVINHQVQYLGTDRRLTYSLLSQDKKLTTLFVPEAVSETVAPQSLKHYLSQRRRWGSNAYFNNYFYMVGPNMIAPTRIAAFIEVLRLSMVYYRFCNTILLVRFIIVKCLDGTFDTMKLVPLLIVSQLPLCWYVVSVMLEKPLRVRAHKLFLGFCINKCISAFISMTVFFNVARNVGSQGMSKQIFPVHPKHFH